MPLNTNSCESTESKSARGAADSLKPGVERSGTPGTADWKSSARGAADSPGSPLTLSAAPRTGYRWATNLGFRCAPPQALCCRPLRGLGLGRTVEYALLICLVAFQACNRSVEDSRGVVVVNAPEAGEIRRVLAREGMEIVEGQPIAEIAIYAAAQPAPTAGRDQKQSSAAINLQAAQAEIESARSEVVRHEVEVQRLTPLVSAGQASQGDLDGERALYERAQQRLQRAKTAAQQAQSGLVSARQQSLNSPVTTPSPAEQIVVVRASTTGTMSAINKRVGERVIAGQPLATIRAR